MFVCVIYIRNTYGGVQESKATEAGSADTCLSFETRFISHERSI